MSDDVKCFLIHVKTYFYGIKLTFISVKVTRTGGFKLSYVTSALGSNWMAMTSELTTCPSKNSVTVLNRKQYFFLNRNDNPFSQASVVFELITNKRINLEKAENKT